MADADQPALMQFDLALQVCGSGDAKCPQRQALFMQVGDNLARVLQIQMLEEQREVQNIALNQYHDRVAALAQQLAELEEVLGDERELK